MRSLCSQTMLTVPCQPSRWALFSSTRLCAQHPPLPTERAPRTKPSLLGLPHRLPRSNQTQGCKAQLTQFRLQCWDQTDRPPRPLGPSGQPVLLLRERPTGPGDAEGCEKENLTFPNSAFLCLGIFVLVSPYTEILTQCDIRCL